MHEASEFVDRIAGALPSGRLVVLPDCGHFSYLECPYAALREIVAFIELSPPG